jgi:hypothetical protein
MPRIAISDGMKQAPKVLGFGKPYKNKDAADDMSEELRQATEPCEHLKRCLTYITTEIDPPVNHDMIHEELTGRYGSRIVPANMHLTDFFRAMGLKIGNVDLDVQMALQASTPGRDDLGRDDLDFGKEIKKELSVHHGCSVDRQQKWTRIIPVDDTADHWPHDIDEERSA